MSRLFGLRWRRFLTRSIADASGTGTTTSSNRNRALPLKTPHGLASKGLISKKLFWMVSFLAIGVFNQKAILKTWVHKNLDKIPMYGHPFKVTSSRSPGMPTANRGVEMDLAPLWPLSGTRGLHDPFADLSEMGNRHSSSILDTCPLIPLHKLLAWLGCTVWSLKPQWIPLNSRQPDRKMENKNKKSRRRVRIRRRITWGYSNKRERDVSKSTAGFDNKL